MIEVVTKGGNTLWINVWLIKSLSDEGSRGARMLMRDNEEIYIDGDARRLHNLITAKMQQINRGS